MSLVVVLCDSNMQMELDVKHREHTILRIRVMYRSSRYQIMILIMISRNVFNEYYIG